MRVTRSYTWAMGHRLQYHDGLCRHPHGHNYRAEVTVEGTVQREEGSEQGMVLDFYNLDKVVAEVISTWDHAFMVEASDPFLDCLRHFSKLTGELPRVVVVPWPPTVENMANEIAVGVGGHHLNVCRVRLYESARSFAEWGK